MVKGLVFTVGVVATGAQLGASAYFINRGVKELKAARVILKELDEMEYQEDVKEAEKKLKDKLKNRSKKANDALNEAIKNREEKIKAMANHTGEDEPIEREVEVTKYHRTLDDVTGSIKNVVDVITEEHMTTEEILDSLHSVTNGYGNVKNKLTIRLDYMINNELITRLDISDLSDDAVDNLKFLINSDLEITEDNENIFPDITNMVASMGLKRLTYLDELIFVKSDLNFLSYPDSARHFGDGGIINFLETDYYDIPEPYRPVWNVLYPLYEHGYKDFDKHDHIISVMVDHGVSVSKLKADYSSLYSTVKQSPIYNMVGYGMIAENRVSILDILVGIILSNPEIHLNNIDDILTYVSTKLEDRDMNVSMSEYLVRVMQDIYHFEQYKAASNDDIFELSESQIDEVIDLAYDKTYEEIKNMDELNPLVARSAMLLNELYEVGWVDFYEHKDIIRTMLTRTVDVSKVPGTYKEILQRYSEDEDNLQLRERDNRECDLLYATSALIRYLQYHTDRIDEWGEDDLWVEKLNDIIDFTYDDANDLFKYILTEV